MVFETTTEVECRQLRTVLIKGYWQIYVSDMLTTGFCRSRYIDLETKDLKTMS